jgi:rRNA maturation RNase YbeY
MVELILNDFQLDGLSENQLQVHISNLIEEEGFSEGDLIFVLLSDDELLEYNKTLLNHDYYTDVITMDQKIGNIISGEILVSYDRVKENAKEHNDSVIKELHRVFFHGVLHIIGYNDKTSSEKELMTSRENFYLSNLSF